MRLQCQVRDGKSPPATKALRSYIGGLSTSARAREIASLIPAGRACALEAAIQAFVDMDEIIDEDETPKTL